MKDIYIVWNKDNEIGIPIIDEQHRVAVGTINPLFCFMQMKRGVANNDATIVLNFLKDWRLDHINKQDRKFAEHLRHTGAL
ncbi:hypothetical protein [uncultured Propionivibrio sp.]|uniref:hypothetical protein n=1 Tax=uncultured Propionivibrio sp. TaxID=426737 RepID=UPI0029BFD062|nr:hypothetical protein [uncultured Propionivibrio sp.]